jgi:GT2 family glycosyltransferase
MRVPAFSIVVVSWRTRELTLACLRSLEAERASGAPEFETVLVDNASGDGTAEAVRREHPGVDLLESERNLGFAAACNRALAHCRGRFVLFLNPDAELRPGTLATVADFFDRTPEATAAGPLLVAGSGEPQFSCGRFLSPVNQFAETLGLHRLLPLGALRRSYDVGAFDGRPSEVDWVVGACMAVRRDALDELGGFDERFFIYAEDEDLCLRLRRRGGRVFVLPALRVLHHGGGSAAQDFDRMRAAARLSQAAYFRKHHGPAAALLFRGLMALARLKPSRHRDRVAWGG